MHSLADRRTTRTQHTWPAVTLAALLAAITMAIAAPAQAHEPWIAKAWGYNGKGELGTGSTEGPETCAGASISEDKEPCSTTPVAVSGLSGVTAMAGGGGLSATGQVLALREDGTVKAWGANDEGQLGNGTTTNSDVPVAVSGLSEVTAIAAGGKHSLALLKNGTVMAWGDNSEGQLGNGTTVGSHVPVAVKELSSVVAIATGAEFSLAVLSSGKVMAWGSGRALGDGSETSSDVPVTVCAVGTKGLCPTGPYLEGVKAVSGGAQQSLALLSSGKVVAWGDNFYGELGNGSVTNSKVPVEVSKLSGVTAISAGGRGANGGQPFSVALLENGEVMAWGDNGTGALGDGTSTGPEMCGGEPAIEPCSKTPVAVSELKGVTAIAAHGAHSLALLAGGTVKAWGSNEFGMLGDGTSSGPEACGASFGSCSTKPIEVNKLFGGKGIGDGDVDSLAFGPPPPTVAAISPQEGPKAGGTTVTITGAEFEEAFVVRFGSATATQVKVSENGTKITAVSPAGAGIVDVTVTTPVGTSPTSAADKFDYERPTIKKLSPKRGPELGGTSVTVTGTNFTGTTAVKFGSTEATSVKVNSATSITAVSPAHTRGKVDVTVSTSNGTSATSSKDRFKYT